MGAAITTAPDSHKDGVKDMTRLELIEALEKATEGSRELDCEIAVAVCGYFRIEPKYEAAGYGYGYVKDGHQHVPGLGGDMLVPNFTTSVDAALTLVPEGYGWVLYSDGGIEIYDNEELNGNGRISEGDTPALALCIYALRARETNNG